MTQENQQYILERKSSYNHRTSASVVWRVVNAKDNFIVAECKTKKEALEWLKIYQS